jgi:hypothetical protein
MDENLGRDGASCDSLRFLKGPSCDDDAEPAKTVSLSNDVFRFLGGPVDVVLAEEATDPSSRVRNAMVVVSSDACEEAAASESFRRGRSAEIDES